MARILSGPDGSDVRRLGAIALGLLALAAIGLPAHYQLDAKRAFALVRDGIDDENYAVPAHPVGLAAIPGGVALLVASGVQDCLGCEGELSVFYLHPDEDGWRVTGAWRDVARAGSWGELGGMATAGPALRLAGGEVVELTAARPLLRGAS